jgi:hypothetical protein
MAIPTLYPLINERRANHIDVPRSQLAVAPIPSPRAQLPKTRLLRVLTWTATLACLLLALAWLVSGWWLVTFRIARGYPFWQTDNPQRVLRVRARPHLNT